MTDNKSRTDKQRLAQTRLATQFVHAGERGETITGKPVSTPVYTSTTFTYDSMQEFDRVFGGDQAGFVYTRYGNPTIAALENALTLLEQGAGACAFASGMAGLHAALIACDVSQKSTVIASQDLYGATLNLLYTIFGAFGVRTVTADFNNLADLQAKAEQHRPRALIAETISNPLLKVCDIKACTAIAHAVNAKLIIDSTFATPFLARPLTHDADFVVHSLTKYLSGHCDTTGGIVVAREIESLPALIGTMKLAGGILGVWEAHEILRGVKTLALRMERQCTNAHQLARHLQQHSSIARVYYPLLSAAADTSRKAETDGHQVNDNGVLTTPILREHYGGALVTVRLHDDTKAAAFRFMDNLNLCVRSTSLGDVFTGVLHPATASHRDLSAAQRARFGITDGTVRISVGIEDVRDIIADIEQALEESEQ